MERFCLRSPSPSTLQTFGSIQSLPFPEVLWWLCKHLNSVLPTTSAFDMLKPSQLKLFYCWSKTEAPDRTLADPLWHVLYWELWCLSNTLGQKQHEPFLLDWLWSTSTHFYCKADLWACVGMGQSVNYEGGIGLEDWKPYALYNIWSLSKVNGKLATYLFLQD